MQDREIRSRLDKARARLKVVEQVIPLLEFLHRTPAMRTGRGRRFMNEKERGDVSTRMKRYWGSRRSKGAEMAEGSSNAT